MNINPSVLRLATAQALAVANATVVYATTGAIIGHMLAPRPEWATLPITMFVAGMALATLPSGQIARRHGRARAFLLGNLCGVLMGLLAALAIVQQSFALFCLATLLGGAYAAVVLTFRFAAAECVAPEDKPRALSMVLAGGVLAGVVGPQMVSATMNAWPPHAYALTYVCSAIVAVLSALVLQCHAHEDGPRVQSINDFVVFGAMALGSLASGGLLAAYGWQWVAGAMLPPVALATLALLWLARIPPARTQALDESR